ncbi:hypothetical protein F383_36377 [Gossypium arboreum]|uniref:Uncharacterized protein n=1 Tax=Gossypium arboreum TaxID=29729 RepID=A0A0B0NBA9_GOSAR|nr:hypothetical protein F383_36377 [Gossypium arboreum]
MLLSHINICSLEYIYLPFNMKNDTNFERT